MTDLETMHLRTCTIVRPAGTCGSMGWHPKAWQCAVVRQRQSAVDAFLRANPNWTRSDIGTVRKSAD